MSSDGYWPKAHWVAIALMAIVAIRLHEVSAVLARLSPALLVTVLGFGLLVARTRADGLAQLWSYRTARWVAAYAAWALATAPLALWPGFAVESGKILLLLAMVFFAFVLCPPSWAVFHRVQVAFIACTGLYAAGVLLHGKRTIDGRLSTAGSYDSNDLASLFALTFPAALALLFGARRGWLRLVGLATSGVLVIGVIQSGSRGGVIALATGMLVYAMGLKGGRSFGMLGALAVGAVIAWSFAPPVFKERISTLTELRSDYNLHVEDGRTAVWKRGLQYFAANPLTGVGAGNFRVAEGEWLEEQSRRGKWSTAHNAFVQAGAELGLVGLALYIAILFTTARRAFRLWRPGRVGVHRPELFAGVCAFTAGAMFLSHAYSYALFALLGIVALADRADLWDGMASAPPRGVRRPAGGVPPRGPRRRNEPIPMPAPPVIDSRPVG